MAANADFSLTICARHRTYSFICSSSAQRSAIDAHSSGLARNSARSLYSAKSWVSHIACRPPSICATKARVIPSSIIRWPASPVMFGRSPRRHVSMFFSMFLLPFASASSRSSCSLARCKMAEDTEDRRPKNWSSLPLTQSVGTSTRHALPNKPLGSTAGALEEWLPLEWCPLWLASDASDSKIAPKLPNFPLPPESPPPIAPASSPCDLFRVLYVK
mmetsp:Transcript_6957/g.28323  ORF Transcript_6957/g.28323 Transcript_6957/m.28323 type:complete len:217 (-) Transcript_6957:1442-2092(-)